MATDINNTEFINIEPGLYDDTMKCPHCKFYYENRADNSHEENRLNSVHECSLYKE